MDKMANFNQALIVLVKGMGGIFFVLFIIYLSIKALMKFFPNEKN